MFSSCCKLSCHQASASLCEHVRVTGAVILQKGKVILDGKSVVTSTVDAADEWLESNETILDGNNQKSDKRGCFSVKKLLDIVQEGNAIYVNMGNGLSKMSGILSQAESWYVEYQKNLVRCNLVQLSQLKAATHAASSDVALDLEEAIELGLLAEKIKNLFYRACIASGEKQIQGKKLILTIDNLIDVFAESALFPVDTIDFIDRLQEQRRSVKDGSCMRRTISWAFSLAFDCCGIRTEKPTDLLPSTRSIVRTSMIRKQTPRNSVTTARNQLSCHSVTRWILLLTEEAYQCNATVSTEN